MKINHPKNPYKFIPFHCLEHGQCFVSSSCVCMKIDGHPTNNCIEMQNACFHKLDGCHQVQLIEAEISYKYIDSAAKIVYI